MPRRPSVPAVNPREKRKYLRSGLGVRADPTPGKKERQGRSASIFFFLRGLTIGTRCGSPSCRPSPIDILYEESYFSARRSTESLYERSHERKEDRSLTGYPRHVGSQGAGPRPYAWAGRFKPHRANNKRSFPGQTRLALSRAAPNGGGGVAHVVMGGVRKQSPG